MLLTKASNPSIRLLLKRTFHNKNGKLLQRERRGENPITRTGRILLNDLKTGYKIITNPGKITKRFPSETDIVVIGGGAIGSSIAYWLKEKSNVDSFDVVVVEKDTSYSKSSTCLSVGGLRQQFSLSENIQMSLFGHEFIRTLKTRFGPHADVAFTPHGYLVLASEHGADQLLENAQLQKDLGAINVVLEKHQIKERFPWMNVDDVALGCLGLEKEGWFDPWSLLKLLQTGSEKKGAQYINGEVVGFEFRDVDMNIEGVQKYNTADQPSAVVVKMPDGELKTIRFSLCVIAAGAESGKVAEKLRIGTGQGILSVPLPVERRKRYVFVFDCEKNAPGLNTPMTIDYSGAYFRRDGLGGKFICGLSPDAENEPDTKDLEVNYEFFDQHVWPLLARRVDAFNAVKVKGAWGGFYEYNSFDENGIIGPHPAFTNVYIATGFSGHGIQQSPAIGRAVSELILDGNFQSIDLTRLGFDRMLLMKPLLEAGII
ncbi:unnamed protein product [Ceutorhynchus assimilis]|uniref:FAD dependent oxidoreductase domain-containing protein n=1 Tax=Ceutorhynchus assimilis TaxID=467358 RepID=A0A9N9QI37_9CUCU|nr:unnamed protein product [Ceutorhynchus assimilis]